jgi:hypothetical protein
MTPKVARRRLIDMSRSAVVSAVVIVLLVAVPTALAKDGLLFDRPAAGVGQSMTLTSPWVNHPGGVVAYFMPLSAAPQWWKTYQAYAPAVGPPPKLRAAIRVGVIKRWHATGGRLTFRVPEVTPGRYVLGFWCRPCNTHWTSALPNFQPLASGILTVRR